MERDENEGTDKTRTFRSRSKIHGFRWWVIQIVEILGKLLVFFLLRDGMKYWVGNSAFCQNGVKNWDLNLKKINSLVIGLTRKLILKKLKFS